MDNNEWILIDIDSAQGRNGVTYWRLTFQRLSDNLLAEMTVDVTYTNFKRSGWDHVVEHDCPWGVYQGLKLTKRTTRAGLPVLTADTPADIIYRCTSHLEACELAQASIAASNQRNNFSTIFS